MGTDRRNGILMSLLLLVADTIKFHSNKIITNFHSKVPKEGIEYVCLPLILVDSVFTVKNYNPQKVL